MYEAMRTRAPDSTKFAGASVTVLVLALIAYALSTGLGMKLIKAVTPPMVVVTLPDPVDQPDPVVTFSDQTDVSLSVPPPLITRDRFSIDDDKPPLTVRVNPGPGPVITGGGGRTPPPRPAPTRPKLMKADVPPYPAGDVRARNEGVSGLEVCINAKGRVTEARLAAASGHTRLDDAAVKWVRSARFSPATRDGAPVAVCGHAIEYQWTLTDAR